MAIFLGCQREKNRQKEGHSGGTYAYEKYREYPPPPPGYTQYASQSQEKIK